MQTTLLRSSQFYKRLCPPSEVRKAIMTIHVVYSLPIVMLHATHFAVLAAFSSSFLFFLETLNLLSGVGGFGMMPACPRSRSTVEDGWAPTDSQYLDSKIRLMFTVSIRTGIWLDVCLHCIIIGLEWAKTISHLLKLFPLHLLQGFTVWLVLCILGGHLIRPRCTGNVTPLKGIARSFEGQASSLIALTGPRICS